ncbi:MAG: tRNA (adenosine(37)-N6)-threonylcarbamoyltransferase complex ATPase subunit type 1 TsaE [Deltaproteobacteria bacterium]|nr:tRNA (adenosine(37)-N6)-threonylcarbamoyltransferase complex ATPase subunit type 1 TsaE [Deltaproteobacteria bacterium]
MTHEFDVSTVEQTQAVGAWLATLARDGTVILLDGALGAGKTTLVQGLARALGVTREVTSPTYAIVHEYPEARVPLYHADVYRLEHPEELVQTGIAERVGESGCWVIEWASKFPGAWPPGVEVQFVDEERCRRLRVKT